MREFRQGGRRLGNFTNARHSRAQEGEKAPPRKDVMINDAILCVAKLTFRQSVSPVKLG